MEELPNGWAWEEAQAEAVKRLGESACVTASQDAYINGWRITTVDLIARLIAQAYGVSKCAIDGIKSGKTWRHVA